MVQMKELLGGGSPAAPEAAPEAEQSGCAMPARGVRLRAHGSDGSPSVAQLRWPCRDRGMPKFGVYTLANDNVLDQLDALYNSFRRYNAEMPIEVIPFDDDTVKLHKYCESRSIPMVHVCLEECDQIGKRVTTNEEKGYKIYRKFSAFCGKFDVFAFVDADTLILGDISDLCSIYDASGFDILFYARSLRDRNYQDASISALSAFANPGADNGFNAGFFLTRRDLFSLAFLDRLSSSGERLRRLLTRGHEQAFLNYAVAVTSARAGLLHTVAPQYAARWQAQEPIAEYSDGFCYQEDAQKLPIRILHWGGPLWGKGPNAGLVQKFSSLLPP
jgi:hypothetical protein